MDIIDDIEQETLAKIDFWSFYVVLSFSSEERAAHPLEILKWLLKHGLTLFVPTATEKISDGFGDKLSQRAELAIDSETALSIIRTVFRELGESDSDEFATLSKIRIQHPATGTPDEIPLLRLLVYRENVSKVFAARHCDRFPWPRIIWPQNAGDWVWIPIPPLPEGETPGESQKGDGGPPLTHGPHEVETLLDRIGVSSIRDHQPEEARLPDFLFRGNKTGTWDFRFEGVGCPSLRGYIGFFHVRQILQNPNTQIANIELASLLRPQPTANLDADEFIDSAGTLRRQDQGDLSDAKALREYNNKLRQLRAEKEEAEEGGDAEERKRLQEEIDDLTTEIRRTYKLSKILSSAPGSQEKKALDAVSKAINRALQKISIVHPALGQHLNSAITRCGGINIYSPKTPLPWKFE